MKHLLYNNVGIKNNKHDYEIKGGDRVWNILSRVTGWDITSDLDLLIITGNIYFLF